MIKGMADYFSAIPFSMLLNNNAAKKPKNTVLVEAFIKSSDNKSKSYWFGKSVPMCEIITADIKERYKMKEALIIN